MIHPARLRSRLASAGHRAAARAARSKIGQRVRRPMVSVIVPFYNVEQYLAACLDSIAGQTTGDFEVILVDDGSPDGSRAIAQEYVARDSRFRLVTRPNGGLGAARNTGIRHARGRFLTFVDSDDLLPHTALAALRDSARRTGSDIVVGAVDRFNSGSEWQPGWVADLHRVRRERIHIDDFLPLLRNLYTWNKLYRHDFWGRNELWFREGVAYEDQPIVTQLMLRAASIDVIPDVVYRYRARDDRSSISQQTATVKDLRDRVGAWRETEVALRDAPDTVRRAWLQTLFDAHFLWYLTSRGTEDDEYWALIQSAVADLTDGVSADIWDDAPPANRVLIELTRQDRRSDLHAFIDQDGQDVNAFESEVADDGILLKLPSYDDPALSRDLFLLRRQQLRIAHMVDGVVWTADGLTLRGRAYLRKLDLAQHRSHVDVVIHHRASGRKEVFAAQDGVVAVCALPSQDSWCDYATGTFEARLPFSAFEGPEGRWEVRLRVSAAGFVVETPVSRLLRAGAPGELDPTWLADGTRLFVDWGHRQSAHVVRAPAALRAVDVRVEGRRVSGSLVGPLAGRLRVLEVASGRTVERARVSTRGTLTEFGLTLPAIADRRPVSWELRAWLTGGNRPVQVELPDLDAAREGVPPLSLVQLARTREGYLRVDELSPGAEACGVESLANDGLRVTGRVVGPGVTSARLTTSSVKGDSLGQVVPVVEGRFDAVLDLRSDVYRFGRLPLGIGEHQIGVELSGDGPGIPTRAPLAISPQVRRALPMRYANDSQEGSLVRGATGALQLNLTRPMGTMAGRLAQHSRQRRLRMERGRATTRGLLCRAYFGEKATDNGVAIQSELRRRGSDLPVYWAVQDHSIPIPVGGIPVVINSAEWYDLLGSVTYYLDNMYQPDYHYKPEGQVVVQTFHGYPFKEMGHPHWRHQRFSRAKVASYGRRAAEWDYLISPATYATPLLTRDFAYDGEVLEIGYPRNDVLQSPEADSIRDRVRASLGIRDDQTALLYAPTFRDYLARDDNEAAMSDFLDFAAIGKAFGDDVVVLMRGHAFNARTSERVGRFTSLVDVTDYPEVNDLYLAADVGVVDFSSLRFDFGVTGKPMVFLVPDIERYVESRGWLFDFDPTAPGPQVRTTDEVIEKLHDLPALVDEYAADYAAFRSSYLSLEDGHAAARFVDAVMAPRGDV